MFNRYTIAVLLTLNLSQGVSQVWEETWGPNFSHGSSIAYMPPYLVLATDYGMFRSKDYQYWERVNDPTFHPSYRAYYIKDIVRCMTRLFATTSGYQLLFSNDAGLNWTADTITGVSLICAQNRKVYLVSGNKIFFSETCGETWKKLNSPPLPYLTRIDGIALFQNKLYVCFGGKVYKSDNNGISWNLTEHQPGADAYGSSFFNDNDEFLYVSSGPSRIKSDTSKWEYLPVPPIREF
jgi:hypothetical protein